MNNCDRESVHTYIKHYHTRKECLRQKFIIKTSGVEVYISKRGMAGYCSLLLKTRVDSSLDCLKHNLAL